MTPAFLLTEIVDPGLSFLAKVCGLKPLPSDEADVMLVSIAGQEGNWKDRYQNNGGPARSFWQFETGGVTGVLNHSVTGPMAVAVCNALDISSYATSVYTAMAWNDHLAVIMARLLLYTSPAKLPDIGDVTGSFAYYEHLWRPGLPGPGRWPAIYAASITTIKNRRPPP